MWGYSDEELAAVSEFADGGGAVVMMGSGRAPTAARENLNEVAAAVGTDLRVTDDRVLDPEHAVRGIEDLVHTGAFEESFELFGRARPGRSGRDRVASASNGIDDPEEFEISGFREVSVPTVESPNSDTEVVREGERIRVEITIEDVNHPTEIRDQFSPGMAQDWQIPEESPDIEEFLPARDEVSLGEVTPEEVAGDQTVTKTYLAVAGTNDPARTANSSGPDSSTANFYSIDPTVALAGVEGQLAVRYFTSGSGFEVVPTDP
jgi:hypothetical protein